MLPRAALAALVLPALLLSGCVGHGDSRIQAETLVLRFTLIDEDGEPHGADPGGHCSRAVVHAKKVRIAAPDLDDLGPGRPLLIVLPTLEGPWVTLGSEGYALAVPASVDPGIEGSERLVGRVGWAAGEDGNGTALVDGDSVTLPHSWVVRAPGAWRIEATLAVGPAVVEPFEPGLCA